ncbi:nitrate- and nitrite sensing domain-containing protein [Methylonatrum kenyense]|uniref:nitrate regulatory protein n=1 Tax=Methylonatrum kenyense TaxID=455253 RepID=UPI0020C0EE7F|nr:nitrate regulatory protein [Methylonatrum kenyense]MCK8516873.1 nitrate- and nitrite sensing domain-containing protein [Methylonatrum kenyense]
MGKQQSVAGTAADYLIASRRCEILGLEHLLGTSRLVVSISNLVHVLQRERGTANLFTGSAGSRCGGALDEAMARSREREQRFRSRLRELDTGASSPASNSRLFNRIAHALRGLDALEAVRDAIRQQSLSPETIIEGYSALIQALLGVVFEAADSAADHAISAILVAMFHLMQGKEFAGQERGIGAAGFAQGEFGQRSRRRLQHLIDSQERCFEVFVGFADAESLRLWNDGGAHRASAELERLRRIALTSGTATANVDDLSEAWFDEASRRIDAMKLVEDQLERSLETLCSATLEQARDALSRQRTAIEALAAEPAPGGTFAVFLGSDERSTPDDGGTQRYTMEWGGEQLGRSLLELLQSQSRRLQAMGEELNGARAALAERKNIERAKGLIMRHRRLTEEEAYRFLREVAMSQSRRLADVAADTIAMADLLGDSGEASGHRG